MFLMFSMVAKTVCDKLCDDDVDDDDDDDHDDHDHVFRNPSRSRAGSRETASLRLNSS